MKNLNKGIIGKANTVVDASNTADVVEAAHLRFCNANDGSFNGEGSSKCS